MAEQASPDDVAYLAGLVRDLDRPRYYAALFAPEKLRADLFALYGFAAEIARIPDQVKDPTLGRIRLQWWVDSLTGDTGEGGSGEAPALRAANSLIRRHALPVQPLEALVTARDADLYADPPADLAELETFLHQTEGTLFQLGAALAGVPAAAMAEAARHAGLAYGLARRLAGFSADRARGRTILPRDVLTENGLTGADVFARRRDEDIDAAIARLAERAGEQLRATSLRNIPREAIPVFLPLVVVPPLLAAVGRQGGSYHHADPAISDIQALLRMGWAKLRGRIGVPDRN